MYAAAYGWVPSQCECGTTALCPNSVAPRLDKRHEATSILGVDSQITNRAQSSRFLTYQLNPAYATPHEVCHLVDG